MRFLLFSLTAFFFTACNTAGNKPQQPEQTTTTSGSDISEVRETPKTAPVQSYEVPVPNELNKWFFRVKLYETGKRFVYRMTMQYEEIQQEQEITFPNFRIEPQPEIRKGSKEYEAIIGFIDDKGAFREYLSVFVQDGNLRVKTLKHYAVYVK